MKERDLLCESPKSHINVKHPDIYLSWKVEQTEHAIQLKVFLLHTLFLPMNVVVPNLCICS